MGFVLRLRHSAKLPEYKPQVRSFGDTALISKGQVIKTMGKLIRNVGTQMTKASEAVKSWGRIVYCHMM